MRGILAAALVAAALVFMFNPAHAEDPVVMDLRVDAPGVVTVGDHVSYTVVVQVDPGTVIDLAAVALPPEVALVDTPRSERAPVDGGREEVTIRFELAPFVAGEIQVPPLPFRYTLPDGSTGELTTVSSVIDVTSVLPAAGQVTPRDLKPQAQIGEPPPTWPLPVAVSVVTLLALALITLFARRRLRKYRVTRALRRIPVYAGPEDEARAELRRAASAYEETGDLTAYYTALGNTMRKYLTRRYEFPAYALTTRELASEMLRMGVDRWQVRVASGLLAQCDAVMYARYRPAGERADADLTAAYEVVEMSRPEERPPVEEEVAVS